MVGTATGFVLNKFSRTDERIDIVRTEHTQTVERVATIEEAIRTIKDDNKEIKSDIKIIKCIHQ